ncbi:MAG TPA: GDSL-type esterase/lipase family protein [Tepidisphaeraceae bacterium]|nr:GDSL-type esterase/lipase family protein [Tepidisphaeraceae bacterium]
MLLLIVLSSSPLLAQVMVTPATAPATTAATTQPNNGPADEPAAKIGRDGKADTRFMELHRSFLWRGKEAPMGVLFLGDSITEGWMTRGASVWRERYWKYVPADFGIGGDRTQHVLWRIDNHELDNIAPKVVVLMIGTNNTANYTAEEITAADKRIVQQIHEKLPETKLLLLAIFPRGADPADPKTAGLREKIRQVNVELAKLDDGDKTRYLDIGPKFLDGEGKITKEMMPDALHPTKKGYVVWADAMQPLLDEMMK